MWYTETPKNCHFGWENDDCRLEVGGTLSSDKLINYYKLLEITINYYYKLLHKLLSFPIQFRFLQLLQVSAATLQAMLFRCHEGRGPDVLGARLAPRQKSCEAEVRELPRLGSHWEAGILWDGKDRKDLKIAS